MKKNLIRRLAAKVARLASRRGRPGEARSESPSPPSPGRRQTIVFHQDRFALLVDEFHGLEIRSYELRLVSDTPLVGERLRYWAHEPPDSTRQLAVHLLGDYALERDERGITLRQRLAHGRFLIAVTRDPEARVRVVSGWAIEIRSGGRVYHLLHSNRSRRSRSLGPFETDAMFALTEWDEKNGAAAGTLGAVLRVAGSRQLMDESGEVLTAAVHIKDILGHSLIEGGVESSKPRCSI